MAQQYLIYSDLAPQIVLAVSGSAGAPLLLQSVTNTNDQRFTINAAGEIINVASGLVLEVEGNSISDGTNIIQNYNNHAANQQWTLFGDGSIRLKSNNAYCLDVEGENGVPNTPIILYTFKNDKSANQLFRLTPVW